MKVGDLIFVKRGAGIRFALPGSRYSQGLVVEVKPQLGAVMVRWYDTTLLLEDVVNIRRYYEVISSETG